MSFLSFLRNRRNTHYKQAWASKSVSLKERNCSNVWEKVLFDFFERTSKEDVNLKWEKIQRMIVHLDNRIHYWDSRRSIYLSIGIALFGGSIAGVLNVVQKISYLQLIELSSLYQYMLLLFALLFVSIAYAAARIIFLWNHQNNPDYPFTKLGIVWIWHYRYAGSYLEPESKGSSDAITKYKDDLNSYRIKFVQASKSDLFEQDISQLFLLIENERYKVKMVSDLKCMFVDSLRLCFALAGYSSMLLLLLLHACLCCK